MTDPDARILSGPEISLIRSALRAAQGWVGAGLLRPALDALDRAQVVEVGPLPEISPEGRR